MTITNRMLTAQEIADIMKVHKKTVLRWIDKNEIPAFRYGSTYRITQEEFEKFLNAHSMK